MLSLETTKNKCSAIMRTKYTDEDGPFPPQIQDISVEPITNTKRFILNSVDYVHPSTQKKM